MQCSHDEDWVAACTFPLCDPTVPYSHLFLKLNLGYTYTSINGYLGISQVGSDTAARRCRVPST